MKWILTFWIFTIRWALQGNSLDGNLFLEFKFSVAAAATAAAAAAAAACVKTNSPWLTSWDGMRTSCTAATGVSTPDDNPTLQQQQQQQQQLHYGSYIRSLYHLCVHLRCPLQCSSPPCSLNGWYCNETTRLETANGVIVQRRRTIPPRVARKRVRERERERERERVLHHVLLSKCPLPLDNFISSCDH